MDLDSAIENATALKVLASSIPKLDAVNELTRLDRYRTPALDDVPDVPHQDVLADCVPTAPAVLVDAPSIGQENAVPEEIPFPLLKAWSVRVYKLLPLIDCTSCILFKESSTARLDVAVIH